MSLLKEFLVLAQATTATVKDSKMCQIFGIVLDATGDAIPIIGGDIEATVKAFLQKFILTTQFSQTSTPMATNLNLFDATVLSTDMAGIAKASYSIDYASGVATNIFDFKIYIPVIQGDGEIQLNWQADLFNNSNHDVKVSFYSNSEQMGSSYFEYNAFTLDNDLQVNLKTDFAKLIVETNFSQINMTMNGVSLKITPEDAIIYDNLKDTAVIVSDIDPGTTAPAVTFSVVTMPSDTGKYILMNSNISSLVLFRLDGNPAVPYATMKVKPTPVS